MLKYMLFHFLISLSIQIDDFDKQTSQYERLAVMLIAGNNVIAGEKRSLQS